MQMRQKQTDSYQQTEGTTALYIHSIVSIETVSAFKQSIKQAGRNVCRLVSTFNRKCRNA